MRIIFLNDNVPNQNFDQEFLKSQLNCEFGYLVNGVNIKGRYFRTGINKEIFNFKPDIIMGYEYSLITIYLILLNRFYKLNAKILSTIDDSIDICKIPQSTFRGWSRNWCIKRLDYLVLLSEEVGVWYTSKKNIPPKKIIVNPIVQNPKKFISEKTNILQTAESYIDTYKLANRKILLFVGRIVQEKGLAFLLNIMPSLIAYDKSILLILVGDGPYTSSIIKLIRNKELTDYVLMPGRFEKSKLYAWYIAADIFILPSIYEPFGAVANESLIFGTPVICSQHAGAASLIIEGENGIVIDPKNEITFIKAVMTFLEKKKSFIITAMEEKQNLMPHEFDYYFLDWNKIA